MTGSLLPLGADTVIPVERIRCDGDVRTVHADAQITAGQFIHRRGSDRPAGSHVLSPGTHIGPAEIAVLANAGCAEVSVARIPRVAVISTGNELVDVGQPVADFQIRSTNDYAIECSLSKRNLALVERVRLHDEPESMQSAIETLYTNNDALILTGGVSMGQFDFVPAVLDKLGVRKVFHRIEQRPGRPMWFGIGPLGKPVFALPGNPVSTLVCLTRYVCPALRQGLGAPAEAPEWVRLNAPVERSPTLSYFVPVRVVSGPDGTAYATAQTTNTSGDFMSLLGTDGFVELAPGHEPWPAGRPAQLFRW
jgi:molybdopterin molybdotransferase